ncbi:IS66 family insertion sequence element accessory protein TnpA [Edaphobacter aggregans]|uniref:IS66 family insertion sequence element accessory protein TnpA n=1 Tax=Edaphobacter aggregans TaxID=570835 RepID=UPI003CCC3351
MGRYREEDVLRWRGLVSEQVASGKSVAAFCGERGLRDWQFYEWKKRLRKAEAASFVAVEVTVPAAPVSSAAVSVQMVGIELRHRRGWSLIVEPGFEAGHLRRLLSVLEMES